MVPVLKSVAWKRIGKGLQRNSHCLDLLPSNDFYKYRRLYLCIIMTVILKVL
jgi:hypothetical protein